MDPYYARVIALVSDFGPLLTAADPDLTARLQAMTTPPQAYDPPDVAAIASRVPGPHGDIPVRVYSAGTSGPWLVWCHGGGWVSGDLDMHESDAVARELVHRTGATVVAVDYRLAVDGVHYPVPLDDVVAVFRWAVAEAGSHGVQTVALGGASAGANLAAGAALRLRDEGGPVPGASLLAYPSVHALLPPASEELAAKIAGLSPVMAFAPEVLTPLVENYLGADAGTAPAYAMPGSADLRGLPRTLVINCEYDGLRASGEAYTASLAEAGVSVEQVLAGGVGHGHLNCPWLDAAQESMRVMGEFLKRG